MSFDLRPVPVSVVRDLCEQFHGYGSAGSTATYAFGVFEGSRVIAAYAWQPPPPGAARNVCAEAPHGVLALSRMVAVPREARKLRHISKPLRAQMRDRIDRTRWPVLITYSDEGQGHNGYVYQCSGWTPTQRADQPFYLTADGVRASRYSNGRIRGHELTRGGTTTIQRWEYWICDRGWAGFWLALHGWQRVPIEGKTWRSGEQAHTYKRVEHGN